MDFRFASHCPNVSAQSVCVTDRHPDAPPVLFTVRHFSDGQQGNRRDWGTLRLSLRLCCLIIWLGCFSGCRTHAHQLETVRTDYYSGRLEQASTTLEHLLEKEKRDADALKLDRALVDLTTGHPQRAEQTLRQVRDRLDHLEQVDVGEQLLSMVRDDQSVAWAGDDYEKVLIRTFLSISNLMHDGGDASAYALQVDQKQNDIIARIERERRADQTQLDFKRLALGPYIHAALLEERHTNFDDIERSRLKVVSWEQEFRDGQLDLERARHGRHSEPGHGVLYLFCLVGRGPYKVEAAEIPTQAAMLIADRILSSVLEQELTPTVAPIKIPVVKPGRAMITSVGLQQANAELGSTNTITNISDFAVQQSEADRANVLARAVVRRTLKKAAMYAAKQSVGAESSPAADIALTLAGIAWEATESADTRCWGLLPHEIQVLRVELPAGEHVLDLVPQRGSERVGKLRQVRVTIDNGRNTYMLANIPDTEVIGEVLTSSQGK